MNDNNKFESVYSTKVRAGKRRTYFFDVRKTKGEDFYITITESTKRFNGDGYDRHKIFLYKEDFNRFVDNMNEVVDHVKNELMPDYDYHEFENRQKEWEAKMEEEGNHKPSSPKTTTTSSTPAPPDPPVSDSGDDEMTW